MVDNKLLEILCCPETKQDVILAEAAIIREINEKIKSGSVVNRGGKAVKDTIDTGLVRDDGQYMYPVRENIPIMLIDEAIPL